MKNTFESLFDIPEYKYPTIKSPMKNKFWTPEYIWHYVDMNVVRVCRINKCNTIDNYWYYSDIDRDIMFSDHTSWVYFITINGYIVKIGETGNPLGIENEYWSYDPSEWETQPKKGSKSRFGRYRNGDTTDERIRYELNEDIKSENNKVEFYATKCKELTVKLPILGTVSSQIHKALEKKLLDYFKLHTGTYPRLNTGRY
jgi:hypothetical protein